MLLQIQNRKSKIQNGFTLIEMLVVVVVVLVVTTLVVMATLRMQDKDMVPKGAGFMQGHLAKARTTALAEKKPTGIRLLISAQNPPGVTAPNTNPPWPPFPTDGLLVVEQIQYIQDPGDFADGCVTTDGDPLTAGDQQVHPETGVVLPTSDPLYGRLIYGPPSTALPYTGFSFGDNPSTTAIGGGAVLPGDAIQFNGGGQMARVESSLAVLSALGVTKSVYHPSQTVAALNRTVLVLDRKLDHPVQLPNVLTPTVNYRIMRQPRPVPGEEPIKLPRNVFVIAADFRDALYPGGVQRRHSDPPFFANGDILFDPSGRVVATSLENMFLWVSDVGGVEINPATNEPFDTNWAIVGIRTRTGAVSVYPVDISNVPNSYYNSARSGRGSGM
jgi:prepilin-type N-terminal cleavage/methylation domain-containing protein